MSDVAVLGAGSWGTVLADLLAMKGVDVDLWAYEPEVARAITDRHENPVYLPGESLSPRLRASHDLAAVASAAPVVCSVVPSHVSRRIFMAVAPHIRTGTPLICATKGIESDSLLLMPQVAAETLPQAIFVALSGPSFAEEVHQGQPTAAVAASIDGAAAERTQQLFATSSFRIYSNDDVIGTALGGSLKNVIAIAAGILEGLGLGNNPRAALLTRGLTEISRLGVAMGARAATFAGLAGMGDLILTCTGSLSRNRQLGETIARGGTLAEYQATHCTVVEGANAARAAARLANIHGVDMPIAQQVSAVLFDDQPPRTAIQVLMERTLKSEAP